MADLSKIKHIVVLMLENRSFDNVFGFLRPYGPDFEGLQKNPATSEPSPDCNRGIAAWATKPNIDVTHMPSPDPGESFDDITQQIYNASDVTGPATMGGFVNNYVSKGGNEQDIMHCFAPGDLPVLNKLANSFAVSDRWFASAPCQTWPNRFFAHAGTAYGYENNTIAGFPFPMHTIFNELEGIVPWKIYFHDFAQAALLSRLWAHFDRFQPFSHFLADAEAGNLPGYSFIEPMYYPGESLPNDMHPPHDVRLADALVANVYNAVRKSPNWTSTLLIVTFDEHGGCYDHVPPPRAVQPEPPREGQFAFDRYGVRVPAVLISPYTQAGSVVRPSGDTPFDHTSIIRTVKNCFGISGTLSAREALAPDLSGALNAPFDINRGPVSIDIPDFEVSAAAVTTALARDVNDMQDGLHIAAANLAKNIDAASVEDLHKKVLETKDSSPSRSMNAGAAGVVVRDAMRSLLARFSGPSAGASGTGAQADPTIYKGH